MENLLKRIYEKKRLCFALKMISHIATALSALVFILLCARAFAVSYISLIRLFVILGAPFAAVTILRRLINAPRPYEIYAFSEKMPKNKRGRSFPSRHAFSVFAIGTAALFVYPITGSALLLVGFCLSAARVLLGLHFLRDVTAGALVGVITSLIGVILASPF